MQLALSLAMSLAFLSEQLALGVPSWLGMRAWAPSWTGRDPDTQIIQEGLRQAPGFLDTFAWWTGRWAGQIPYYRPLTSYLFWFEWKAFGDREWLYVIPTALAHVAAGLLFTLLAFRLAAARGVRWPVVTGLVAAWGFVWGFSGLFYHLRAGVNYETALLWKNQPESWTAICCFAALLCLLRARMGSRRWLAAATSWFAVGCAFKELALCMLAVFAALEAEALLRGERATRRRLVVLAGVGVTFIVLRFVFIRQGWYSYAANRAWVERTLTELLGPFAYGIVGGEWVGNAIALWLLAVLAAASRLRRRAAGKGARPGVPPLAPVAAAVTGAVALSTLGLPSLGQYSWADCLVLGGMLLVSPEVLNATAATLGFLLAAWVLWRRDPWSLLVTGAWTAAFLALYTFSPGNIYRYYLPQCGTILMLALAAGWAAPGGWEAVARGWGARGAAGGRIGWDRLPRARAGR